MSLFPRFKRSIDPADDYWYYPVGATTATGVKISEKTALKYLTVTACVSLISSDIAKLPLNLYRKRADGGKDLVTDHKLYDLLHNAPNPDTTSFNWREALQGHLLLWGNSFAFIDRDKTGKIKALWQLPDPSKVSIKRIGNNIVYQYEVDGKKVNRTREQVFHIPGYGFNGLVGMSMINIASEAIGLGVAAEEFGSLYFGEGTHPAGVLEMDNVLGDNKADFVKSLKEGYAGLGKSHKIMLLENGLKYKPLTIPLNDAQFLECVTPDTYLSMSDGSRKKAKDIKVGDGVIGWENDSPIKTHVNAIDTPKIKKLIKLKTSRGRELIASEDHPCLCVSDFRTPGGRPKAIKQEWVQIKDLRKGNYVRVGLCKLDIESKISFDQGYFLGAMVGDGYIRKGGCSFSNIDNGVHNKMNEFLNALGGELRKIKRSNCDYSLATNSVGRKPSKIRTILNESGLIGKHSDTKTIPENILSGGKQAWIGFLSGYFDTDGTIRDINGSQNVCLSWTSVNKQLLEECQHLLSLLGIQSAIYLNYPDGKKYIFGKNSNVKALWGLYVMGNSPLSKLAQILRPYHSEKSKRLAEYLNLPESKYREINFLYDRVVSVEAAGEGETIGIEINGCHTHITSGIVTHNTRNYQKIEICGMYHVPPHKIAVHGQNSNYNNLEQENASYVDSCLMGWIVRWESNISLQLLTEAERRSGLFFEFVVQGLLRGDSKARAEYYNKIFQVGGITPNQIRAKENMNPVEGGDESFVMLNMIPLSQAKDMPLPENEPEIENKSFFKAFFNKKRSRKVSEAHSIMIRDRILRQYAPLILDAAQAIVNRESKAIKNQVHKQSRTNGSMEKFLDDFYRKFPDYIEKKIGPVLRSYLLAIIDATNDELQIDGEDFDNEIREYIDIYSKRHISSSKGQMESLIPAGLMELDIRADEWQERRPEKIKSDESVRASSFAFQTVAFAAGMSTVFRNRGPKTCPFCRSLEGKVVRKGGPPLVSDGEELKGKGTDQPPMLIRGTKLHPAIHQGCDCYLSII